MRTGFIDDLRNCKQCGSLEHENDLRDDLCPNCYYYFKQIKQELEEKDKEINSLIVDYEKRISQEQELMSNLEKELAELKEKDNYHLRYELAGADETITNLKKQLEEKDKEIERLKVFERIYYQNQLQASQEDINKLFQSAYQSPIAVGLNEIAIQELEKVKIELKNKICMVKNEEHCYSQRFISWYEMCDQINKQIKELKGEKK